MYNRMSQQATPDGQIQLDQAYQDFLFVVQTIDIKENIDSAMNEFYDFVYYLETDSVKTDRLYAIEYLTYELGQLAKIVTTDSLAAIQAICDAAIINIQNAVDEEAISDVENQALYDMWDAQVNDPDKIALQNTIYNALYHLDEYGGLTRNYLADDFMWYVYTNVLENHFAILEQATQEEDIPVLLDQAKQELAIYEVFDLERLNDYRIMLISDMTERLGWVPDPAPYQAAYDNAVNQINNSNHPFEMKLIYDEFVDLVSP